MIPEHLKITNQERKFLQKWVEICTKVLAEDESWEDGVLLKGLQRRMTHPGYVPSILDIKQWYTASVVSQDLLEYQNEPHDVEKEKLTNIKLKLTELLNHFGYEEREEC